MILVFDLDGTISDPSEGITASLNFALENLGLSTHPALKLTKYIGPSLIDIFSDLLNTDDDDLIRKAIVFFRKRYANIGYKENVLYPEIKNILKTLSNNHDALYIATTKKPEVAQAVAEYFGISHYFKEILGCGSKRKKVELIQEIREKENNHDIVMIGDRFIDMVAGKSIGCFCVGVLWGFGSQKELKDSGADILLDEPEELLELAQLKDYYASMSGR
ncbi:MAG: HAD-IA family hydrolase [Deltaproteobacteria bacterium]|nr:HAD-IA family hydrolase [Deltaproteobacteria bacterium]MBW1847528.1 HAD-IA family hydrolase [Deltaproteobacteria bacterium]MBW1984169.1 HAD-IA family hydrolase [Deltaproteobacteria bacterium]MBW2179763.1 HAD-IA family hydrolase [Deltaproteobacteria bacterium]MBW2365882.1 HAD-IA family hydrolase [Deltaproteobacteria bacterium]